MSTTANAGQYSKDDIMLKLLEVEEKIETLSTASGSGNGAILSKLNDIDNLIYSTHLVDPFDVAVSICTEIEGGAAIEGYSESWNRGIVGGSSWSRYLRIRCSDRDFAGGRDWRWTCNIRSDVETYMPLHVLMVFLQGKLMTLTNSTDNELADLLASFDV